MGQGTDFLKSIQPQVRGGMGSQFLREIGANADDDTAAFQTADLPLGDRFQFQSFASTPEAKKSYAKKLGFADAREGPAGWEVLKPGETRWRLIDEPGMSLGDLVDIPKDVTSIGAQILGGVKGAALGTPGGPLGMAGGAMLGSGLGALANEAAWGATGKALGFEQSAGDIAKESGKEFLWGAATEGAGQLVKPLIRGTGKLLKKPFEAGRAVKEAVLQPEEAVLRKQADELFQKQLAGDDALIAKLEGQLPGADDLVAKERGYIERAAATAERQKELGELAEAKAKEVAAKKAQRSQISVLREERRIAEGKAKKEAQLKLRQELQAKHLEKAMSAYTRADRSDLMKQYRLLSKNARLFSREAAELEAPDIAEHFAKEAAEWSTKADNLSKMGTQQTKLEAKTALERAKGEAIPAELAPFNASNADELMGKQHEKLLAEIGEPVRNAKAGWIAELREWQHAAAEAAKKNPEWRALSKELGERWKTILADADALEGRAAAKKAMVSGRFQAWHASKGKEELSLPEVESLSKEIIEKLKGHEGWFKTVKEKFGPQLEKISNIDLKLSGIAKEESARRLTAAERKAAELREKLSKAQELKGSRRSQTTKEALDAWRAKQRRKAETGPGDVSILHPLRKLEDTADFLSKLDDPALKRAFAALSPKSQKILKTLYYTNKVLFRSIIESMKRD